MNYKQGQKVFSEEDLNNDNFLSNKLNISNGYIYDKSSKQNSSKNDSCTSVLNKLNKSNTKNNVASNNSNINFISLNKSKVMVKKLTAKLSTEDKNNVFTSNNFFEKRNKSNIDLLYKNLPIPKCSSIKYLKNDNLSHKLKSHDNN